MRAALKKSGIDPIAKGDVRIVKNTDVVWTHQPNSETHRVVVTGSSKLLQDPEFPLAWIIPCTTTPAYADGVLEVEIPAGEDGFTKAGVYAVTYLQQPIRKEYLGKRVGTVSSDTLLLLAAGVVDAFELVDEEDTEGES